MPKRSENHHVCQFFRYVCPFFPGGPFWRFWVPKEAFGNLTQPAWCRTSKGKSKEGAIHLCQWQSWLQWANKSSTLDVQKASSKTFTTFVLMDSGTQNLKNPNSQAWCPTSTHMPKRRPAILGRREELPIHQNCQIRLRIWLVFTSGDIGSNQHFDGEWINPDQEMRNWASDSPNFYGRSRFQELLLPPPGFSCRLNLGLEKHGRYLDPKAHHSLS